jgi:prepilin-type N-terminal cleavage/methylation domain-containing protein
MYKSSKSENCSKRLQKGFSLIEILIVLGILGIISMGLMTMISNQSKEFKAADEKMSLQSTQLLITNVLSSSAFCTCFMGANTFNYTTKTWNGFPTSIGSAYDPAAACAPVVGTFPLLTVGTPIGNSKLKPQSMVLDTITETTPGSGNFSANLSIEFDSLLLVRSRKKLAIPMYFTVKMSDPVGAKSLITCTSATSGALDFIALCAQMNGVYNGSTAPPSCQPAYQ